MINLAPGRGVALNPAPNASFLNWPGASLLGADWTADLMGLATNGSSGDIVTFASSGFFLWVRSADDVSTLRLDLGAASIGELIRVFGAHNFGANTGLPKAIKTEWSDDDSNWTQVQNLTGLTNPAGSGARPWQFSVDISGAGSHRYWRLSFTHSSPNIAISEVQFLYEEPTAPAAPVLTVGSTTDDTIDLSWTNVAGETGFRIERSLDGSTGWVDLGDNPADDTTFTDTGLTCETEYFYRIFAFNGVGDSPASNVDSGTTDTCPVPAAPSNLVATAAGPTQINLAWDDNSTDETGFRVERSPDGVGSWVNVSGNLAPGTEAYANTGLTCETAYFYRVFAFNGTGDSAASNTDDATTTTCPPPGGGNRMGGTGAVRKPPRAIG